MYRVPIKKLDGFITEGHIQQNKSLHFLYHLLGARKIAVISAASSL